MHKAEILPMNFLSRAHFIPSTGDSLTEAWKTDMQKLAVTSTFYRR